MYVYIVSVDICIYIYTQYYTIYIRDSHFRIIISSSFTPCFARQFYVSMLVTSLVPCPMAEHGENHWLSPEPRKIGGTDSIYFWPKFQGISPENMAQNMVRLRTSMYWILKFSMS